MIHNGAITVLEIRRLVGAMVLQAAVEHTLANTPHPTVAQVLADYAPLLAAINPEPRPRPVADPSKWTANVVGG